MSLRFSLGLSAIATVLIFLAAMSFAADKKQLTAALAAVDANLKTAAGKQYDALLGKEFPDKYWPSVRQCKQSLPPGTSLGPFDMFLRLNADGEVQEVLVYPETQFANCTRTALLAGTFSHPPHDDYWINIHLEVKH
jgi:hypothetical protein